MDCSPISQLAGILSVDDVQVGRELGDVPWENDGDWDRPGSSATRLADLPRLRDELELLYEEYQFA